MSEKHKKKHFHFLETPYLHPEKDDIDKYSNDYYGFERQYDRRIDTINNLEKNDDEYGLKRKKPKNIAKIFWTVVIVIGILIYASMSIIAGYIAWKEYPDDNLFNKSIKTYLAVIFSPCYLMYVFIKMTLFKTKI